jgi:hypothetical protein
VGAIPKCIRTSLQKSFDLIEGSASIALFFEDQNNVLLFTNNGSLYFCPTLNKEEYVFASERHIVEQLFKKKKIREKFDSDHIQQLVPGFGYLIDLETLDYQEIQIDARSERLSRKQSLSICLKIARLPANHHRRFPKHRRSPLRKNAW